MSMSEREIAVHQSHCCLTHGCKYGQSDVCPVANEVVVQDYKCESCILFPQEANHKYFFEFVVEGDDEIHRTHAFGILSELVEEFEDVNIISVTRADHCRLKHKSDRKLINKILSEGEDK